MRLDEISEESASGNVAALFADIRTSMDVPTVNLIHRYLATIPGALEYAWQLVRPAFADRRVDRAVDLILRAAPLPALPEQASKRLADAVERWDRETIDDILAVYNHANPRNLIAFHAVAMALERGARADTAQHPNVPAPGATTFASGRPFPKLLNVDTLDDATRDRILEIVAAQHISGTDLIPSLYRHLANWPRYIEAMHDALLPLLRSGDIQRSADWISGAARARAVSMLPSRTPPIPPELFDARDDIIATLERFLLAAIPQMVVIGRLLAA